VVVVADPQEDDAPPAGWDSGMASQMQLMRATSGEGTFPMNDRVQQLHVERLVKTPGGMALDSRDAWVDVQTGGARIRATAHLPLRDLGSTALGLHLYAGRTASEVVFVATRTIARSNLFVERKDQGAQMSNCGHLSVRLDVKRGLSEMAAFQTLAEIADPAEVAARRDSDNAELQPRSPSENKRTRLGRIVVSSAWEPGDKGPLVAFSEGWTSRTHDE
jgi:hypothetical protein